MALDAYPVRNGQAEVVEYWIKLEGTGASAPTLTFPAASAGISVARTSAGIYTLTWTDDPGTYLCTVPGFEDTTPANLDDHSCIVDNYASKVLTITVYDGTPAVDDLEANEYLCLKVAFKRTSL